MSELLLQLTENPTSILQNWWEIMQEIDSEFSKAATSDYRASLLTMFKIAMDVKETTIAVEDLEKFKDSRLKHYRCFIVQETLVGENVCTETLYSVTKREVEAGRMTIDDELYLGAINAMAAPHLSRTELIERNAEKQALPTLEGAIPTSGWRRALSWLTNK